MAISRKMNLWIWRKIYRISMMVRLLIVITFIIRRSCRWQRWSWWIQTRRYRSRSRRRISSSLRMSLVTLKSAESWTSSRTWGARSEKMKAERWAARLLHIVGYRVINGRKPSRSQKDSSLGFRESVLRQTCTRKRRHHTRHNNRRCTARTCWPIKSHSQWRLEQAKGQRMDEKLQWFGDLD